MSQHDFAPESPEAFVSYSSMDVARASALADRLSGEGFRVWFDKARLSAGCDWHKEIEKGCESARLIIALLTPNWKKSEWTRYETYGHEAVVPLIAEGTAEEVLTPPLRRWQAQTFDPHSADVDAWRALFAAIRVKLAEPAPERAKRLMRFAHDPCKFFAGRDADLVRMHEELHEGPVAALTQVRVRAIVALGGVGKTTLANEYARRFWRLYDQIFWVDARRGYENEFAEIHDLLFPERVTLQLSADEKAKAALRELETPAERLLVLDNVEDEVSCRNWIPRSSACRTLITSRFADWPQAAGVRTIKLDVLERDAARQFLVARSGRNTDGSDLPVCDELAKRLGYLPLALEVAAAYIAEQSLTFTEYLNLFDAATATLLSERALGSTHYPDSVIATWRTTIEKFSPLARAILRLASCLAETPIPFELFKTVEPRVREFSAIFGAAEEPKNDAEAELALRAAVAKELHCYSMALEWNGKSFRVHGLVQAVEWLRSSEDEKTRTLALAYDLITTYGPEPAFQPKSFPIWDILFPHAEAAHRRGHEHPANPPSLELIGRLDEYTFGRGRFTQSLEFSLERLGRSETEFGAESDQFASDLINVGEALRELGKREEAQKYFRRSVEIRRKRGPSIELATSLNYLGMALSSEEEATAIIREGIEICKSSGDFKSDTYIKLSHNLASSLGHQGQLKEAKELYANVLASLSDRDDGGVASWKAYMHGNLGLLILRKFHNPNEAEPHLKEALKIRTEYLGETHPSTGTSLGALGECMLSKGNIAEAESLFRRAVVVLDSALGHEHPSTTTAIGSLGACLLEKGDVLASERYLRQALDARERNAGAESPLTASVLMILAKCLGAKGDAVGAVGLAERAVTIYEKHGTDGAATLDAKNNLAALRGCSTV